MNDMEFDVSIVAYYCSVYILQKWAFLSLTISFFVN